MVVGCPRPPSLPLRGLRGAGAPLRKRPAIHPGQTACNETHAAFGRRSTTGCSPRRCAPLIVALRSEYTRASSPGGGSSLTRLVSRAPRPHRENWPASALTRVPPPAVHRVATRRSSLRFGRNTLGIPPSRALSAERLAPTGRTGRPRCSRHLVHGPLVPSAPVYDVPEPAAREEAGHVPERDPEDLRHVVLDVVGADVGGDE